MNTEEPAWRRELGASIDKIDPYHTEDWLQLLEPHIGAAEERGREAALREAAAKIRAWAAEPMHPTPVTAEMLPDLVRATASLTADLIDPDKL